MESCSTSNSTTSLAIFRDSHLRCRQAAWTHEVAIPDGETAACSLRSQSRVQQRGCTCCCQRACTTVEAGCPTYANITVAGSLGMHTLCGQAAWLHANTEANREAASSSICCPFNLQRSSFMCWCHSQQSRSLDRCFWASSRMETGGTTEPSLSLTGAFVVHQSSAQATRLHQAAKSHGEAAAR